MKRWCVPGYISFLLAIFNMLFLFPTSVAGKTARLYAAQFLIIEDKSLADWEQTVIKLKEAGVNTIIVRAYHNVGDRPHKLAPQKQPSGVYFHSEQAPIVADILASITKVAHKHNLLVFALMATRGCDWKLASDPNLHEYAYDLANQHIVPVKGLNIFSREVRYYLEALYRELAQTGIDGIVFQDDLVLRNTEGFSNEAQQRFYEKHGKKIVPKKLYLEVAKKDGHIYPSKYDPLFWEWVDWKCQELLKLADTLSRHAKLINPKLKIGLNIYYETVLDAKNARAWLAQNMTAIQKYPFDYYVIMAYHRQMKRELGLSDDSMFSRLKEMAVTLSKLTMEVERVVVKVQVINWITGKNIPSEEIDRVLATLTQPALFSLAYVPHQKTTPPLAVIKKYFHPAQ